MGPALKWHWDEKRTGNCKAAGLIVTAGAQGAEGHCALSGPPDTSVQDHIRWPAHPSRYMVVCLEP